MATVKKRYDGRTGSAGLTLMLKIYNHKMIT